MSKKQQQERVTPVYVKTDAPTDEATAKAEAATQPDAPTQTDAAPAAPDQSETAQPTAAPNPLAALVAKVAEIAPAAEAAAAPEKRTTARVIKPDTVAVFLLLAQRTKDNPTYRVNMTKPMRRRARRLVDAKLVINAKNGNGHSMFYLNPAAPADLVAEYVAFAEKEKIKAAREVPNAGRDADDK